MNACVVNAVEFDNVTLSLGGREVLRAVSLALGGAALIGVLGPNGAGKTTLMRAILGLVTPRAGTIRVLGQAAARGNPAVGYMPQMRATGAGLRLSGRGFVAAVIDGHRLGLPFTSREQRREVDWALEMVGASRLAGRPLAELSGGERQRLLLAQALIGRPKLLLLDEPLISLDPHYQAQVVAVVKRLVAALNITVLFSAHELNPLLGALDQVLYLGNGQAALGTVDEVITPPVLSRLYGAEIDVVRVGGRIFVMAGGHDVERHAHDHDRGHDHGHDHGTGHEHHHA